MEDELALAGAPPVANKRFALGGGELGDGLFLLFLRQINVILLISIYSRSWDK